MRSVLVREEEGKQSPIYYLSKTIAGLEVRYTKMKKLVLALIISARKLQPYFQAHPIVLITSTPYKSTVQPPDLLGRLTKWEIELGEFVISYIERQVVKSQVLEDFVADFFLRAELPEENFGITA